MSSLLKYKQLSCQISNVRRVMVSTIHNNFTSDYPGITVQNYRMRKNENLEQKRARLLYQSRKRGMLENGLLLSTFAHKYLNGMSETQMQDYDKIINLPSNDWDLFNWMMNIKETPQEFDNDVMNMLKSHARNDNRETRLRQPDLEFPS